MHFYVLQRCSYNPFYTWTLNTVFIVEYVWSGGPLNSVGLFSQCIMVSERNIKVYLITCIPDQWHNFCFINSFTSYVVSLTAWIPLRPGICRLRNSMRFWICHILCDCLPPSSDSTSTLTQCRTIYYAFFPRTYMPI